MREMGKREGSDGVAVLGGKFGSSIISMLDDLR